MANNGFTTVTTVLQQITATQRGIPIGIKKKGGLKKSVFSHTTDLQQIRNYNSYNR